MKSLRATTKTHCNQKNKKNFKKKINKKKSKKTKPPTVVLAVCFHIPALQLWEIHSDVMYALHYFRIVVVIGSAAKCLHQLRSLYNTIEHDILNVLKTISVQLVSFVILFYGFVEKSWEKAQRLNQTEGSMAQKINPHCRISKENHPGLGQLRMAFWRKCFSSKLEGW